MFEKYDVIIFDFDGVIIDSNEIKNECFKKLFIKYDISDKVNIKEGGKSRYDKIKYFHKKLLNINLTNAEVYKLADKYSEMTRKLIQNSDLIPGIRKFLEDVYLKNDLYIVSNASLTDLILISKEKNIYKFFTGIYGQSGYMSIDKYKIIKAISYKHKNVVFIGDQLTDYNNAKKANVDFIGMNYNKSNNSFPKDTKIIHNFLEMV